MSSLQRAAWPDGASLSDAEVDALHVAHHDKPRDVLGCHRRETAGARGRMRGAPLSSVPWFRYIYIYVYIYVYIYICNIYL